MKEKYIAPEVKLTCLLTDDNIAQFVISSRSVGENEGLAKQHLFDDEESESFDYVDNTDYQVWKKE